ncbi:hypothetical protein Y1Q_0013143 [Alligator mississippiensis]|uniref:Uncharacterized protein n=1 Tax=Alligator mississippiensis TaxID=8496 RepID=A0A151NH46_ALLMI|nr:hypothetical protein Y1Q_0013143 [Alligator mississippiensis]
MSQQRKWPHSFAFAVASRTLVKYRGHIMLQDRVRTDPKKTEALTSQLTLKGLDFNIPFVKIFTKKLSCNSISRRNSM